jgi:hypothetical protein
LVPESDDTHQGARRTSSRGPLLTVLAVPLGHTHAIDTNYPAWEDLASVEFPEPPSIGILHIAARRQIDLQEEYRRYIGAPDDLRCDPASILLSYYRCFCPSQANREEFVRCLYVEAAPRELLLVDL